MFIAGMRDVQLVGTCERLENPDAPVWSAVHLENVEALGAGTLAYDEESGTVLPHIHVSVGIKAHSATAHTSHLLGATIHFLTELYIAEVAGPRMSRHRNPNLYDVPLLTFGR
jgi:predicted DNA-binding protein with PD1-like motif